MMAPALAAVGGLVDPACPVNWRAPLNWGLTAWWKVLRMWGRGSTWHDLTGRVPAQLVGMGATTATSGWNASACPAGTGELRFDATDDTLTTGKLVSTFVSDTGGTMAAWIKPIGVGGTQSPIHFLPLVCGTTDGYFGLFVGTYTGLDRIWVYMYDNQNRILNATYTAGAWVHAAWVFRAGTLAVYVNGRLMDSASGIGAIGSMAGNFALGNRAVGSLFFAGAMHEVRTWNRGLSDAEMWQLYATSLRGSPQELNWLTWPMVTQTTAAAFALDDEPWWYQIREVA